MGSQGNPVMVLCSERVSSLPSFPGCKDWNFSQWLTWCKDTVLKCVLWMPYWVSSRELPEMALNKSVKQEYML